MGEYENDKGLYAVQQIRQGHLYINDKDDRGEVCKTSAEGVGSCVAGTIPYFEGDDGTWTR